MSVTDEGYGDWLYEVEKEERMPIFPHDPCWHVKDHHGTHGVYGCGFQKWVPTLPPPQIICCECGATTTPHEQDSMLDLKLSHDEVCGPQKAVAR
jgi:hypothetical protein